MEYLYYPGCSLESSGKPYDESLRAVFRALGIGLRELEDWNCCGATMYMSVNEALSLAISARNLALAEQAGFRDLIAPCSACYTVLLKTNRFLRESPELRAKVDQLLGQVGLKYSLGVKVRHPLDVLVNEVGVEAIASAAKRSLEGIAFAPYYGCQIVRPERGFDDAEFPFTMDTLFQRLGARAVYFPLKTRCCGGMLMTTFPDVCSATGEGSAGMRCGERGPVHRHHLSPVSGQPGGVPEAREQDVRNVVSSPRHVLYPTAGGRIGLLRERAWNTQESHPLESPDLSTGRIEGGDRWTRMGTRALEFIFVIAGSISPEP